MTRRRCSWALLTVVVGFVACAQTPDSPTRASSSPMTPPPLVWVSIEHAGSWSLRYPSTWHVQRLVNICSGSLRGVVVSNTSFHFTPHFDRRCSWRRFGRWEMAGFPDEGVALAIEPKSWFPLGGPDYPPVSMPPALGGLHLTAGLTGGPFVLFAPLPHFVNDSYGYEVRVWIGREAGSTAVSLLQNALESVRVVRVSADGRLRSS